MCDPFRNLGASKMKLVNKGEEVEKIQACLSMGKDYGLWAYESVKLIAEEKKTQSVFQQEK